MRKLIAVTLAMCALMLGGCTSLPPQNNSDPTIVEAKAFSPAPEGKGYVYVYRDSWFARLIPMEVYLDSKSLGDSYNKSFFLLKLDAGKTYKLATDSEFGNNEVDLNIESGKTYYIRHYARMGVVLTQADFEFITKPDDIKSAQDSIKDARMNLPEKS